MTREELNRLIDQWENAKVDFKRQWYWNDNMPNNIKETHKNELVKDLIALTNGDVYSTDKKAYLIIGIDDESREIYNFDKSTILPLDKLKQQLLTLLNNYAQPEFLALDIELVDEVLVISIPPRGSLISLSKDLQLKNKNTDKRGTTYYRVGEDICVASPEIIKKFEKAIDSSAKSKQLEDLNEFEPKKEINEKSYLNQKGKISLSASLPVINHKVKSFTIDCEITFRLDSNIRTLLVKEYDVLKYLFSGYKSKAFQKNIVREWISFDDEKEIYTIQIASTTLKNISIEVIEILSDILDDLQETYASQIKNMEKKLNSTRFPFSSKCSNGFELCRIDKKLWKDIKKFVSKHHILNNTDKNWDIFGLDQHETIVCNDKREAKLRLYYDLYTDISYRKGIVTSEIIIIWNSLSLTYNEKLDNHFMTVNESHDWIVDKLIPKVIKEELDKKTNKENKFFWKKISNSKLKNKNYLKPESLKDEIEIHPLVKLSRDLENYLAINEISITSKILIELYEGLILIFRNSSKFCMGYLYKKFYHIGNKNTIKLNDANRNKYLNQKYTVETFINKINVELNEIKKDELSIDELLGKFTLQYILKCYISVIEDNIDFYGESFIYDIFQKLKGIQEIYDVVKVRERRLQNFRVE